MSNLIHLNTCVQCDKPIPKDEEFCSVQCIETYLSEIIALLEDMEGI